MQSRQSVVVFPPVETERSEGLRDTDVLGREKPYMVILLPKFPAEETILVTPGPDRIEGKMRTLQQFVRMPLTDK